MTQLPPGATSYHSHSRWSDGSASVTEMIAAAEAAGLAEFGLSDHYVLPPRGPRPAWSMPLEQVDGYVEEVLQAAAEAWVTVRLGIEVDFFPETIEETARRLSGYPFDYRIGSVHFVDDFPVDATAAQWAALSPEQVTEKHRLYWIRLAQLAHSGKFDFVGHLDLPKKFGFFPHEPLTREIDAALEAIAAADLAVELNTSGWDKPCAEAYPSLDLLRRCRQAGIPVLMNDDSHSPTTIGAHFHRGARWLRQAGYDEVVRFARRQRTPHPLA